MTSLNFHPASRIFGSQPQIDIWSGYINNPCKIDIHVYCIKEKEKPMYDTTQSFIIYAAHIKKCNINIDRNILTHICPKKRVCLFTNLLYKTWKNKAIKKISKKYYIDSKSFFNCNHLIIMFLSFDLYYYYYTQI